MKTTRSFLLLLMLLATSGLNAQKEEDKYAALVSEVRNEVWSLNLPDFKNMTVPEKYRNEPAVILAVHSRLEVTRKTKLDWWGMGLTKQQITCRSIYRQMVYINSQSALEEMSQFSFLSQEKERYTRNEQQRILGVRIIKPDGHPAARVSHIPVCRPAPQQKQTRRSTWKPMKAATHVAATSKRNGTSWPYPDWKSETSSTCSSYDTPY